MSEDKQFLNTDGVRQILTSINENFSRKKHTHSTADVTGLSTIAKTGKFSDLIGVPAAVTSKSATATSTTAGLVKPGTGLSVSSDGTLSVNVYSNGGIVYDTTNNGLSIKLNSSSPLTVDSSGLKLNIGSGLFINSNKKIDSYHYSITITGLSWDSVFTQLKTQITNYLSAGRTDDLSLSVFNSSLKSNNFISIDMPYKKILAFNNINTYNDTNIPKFINTSSRNWKITGVCETDTEIIAYEKLMLLSNENIVDVFGIEYMNYIISDSTLLNLRNNLFSYVGRELCDFINVSDLDSRLSFLFTSIKTKVTTFIFDYSSNTYVEFINKFLETN